jgi:hypothetical protein
MYHAQTQATTEVTTTTAATAAAAATEETAEDTTIRRIAQQCVLVGRVGRGDVMPHDLISLGPETCCAWTGHTRHKHKDPLIKDPVIKMSGKRVRVREYLYTRYHKRIFGKESGCKTFNKQIFSVCGPDIVCVNPHHLYVKADRRTSDTTNLTWLSKRNVMLVSLLNSDAARGNRKPLAIPTRKLQAIFKTKTRTSISQRMLSGNIEREYQLLI